MASRALLAYRQRRGHNDGGLVAQEHDSNTGLIDRLNRGFAQNAGFCFDYRWFVTPAFIAVAFGHSGSRQRPRSRCELRIVFR